MTLPVLPVQFPPGLAGTENGKLAVENLTKINEWGSLYGSCARAWNALVFDASNLFPVLPLTFTFGGMYRSYDDQVKTFLSRYRPGYVAGNRSNKKYNGQWYHIVSGAIAATPGTSNHGWGLAIDMAYDTDTSDGVYPDDAAYIVSHPQWPWLLENVISYGFSFELQSEPWHIRYILGDDIAQRVLEFEDATGDGVAVPVPTPPPTAPPTEESGSVAVVPTTIKLGSTGGWVNKAQAILSYNFGQQAVIGNIDGQFGGRTDEAVKNVQRFFGLTVDGICGPKTWDILFNIAP